MVSLLGGVESLGWNVRVVWAKVRMFLLALSIISRARFCSRVNSLIRHLWALSRSLTLLVARMRTLVKGRNRTIALCRAPLLG